MKHSDRIAQREGKCLPVPPVSVVSHPLERRIAITIRHNRARGTHSIKLMANTVQQLVEVGLSDNWIISNIGMNRNELLR